MPNPGALFAFEGPDGVGKTTLASCLRKVLSETTAAPVSVLSFPGRRVGTLGALVYRAHHDAQGLGIRSVSPTSLQLLHVAAHLDGIERDIRPRVEAGEIVLLDRYWWSTWVYGLLAGADPESLEAMIEIERRHWGDLHPTAIFLIRRPAVLVPASDQAEHAARDQVYQALAARDESVIEIDNSENLNVTVDRIADEAIRRLIATRPLEGS